MKITPSPLTINQLFSSEHEQFVVPPYQRRYAWGEKQVGDLFRDIELMSENDEHLLGQILFLAEAHRAGINELELVDGQQRITTLAVLFKALSDKFSELNDSKSVSKIKNHLTTQGIDRKTRHKIVLGDLDQPDFAIIMESKDHGEAKNKNLVGAYAFFCEKLKNYDADQTNTFYFKLLNNATVIRLDIGKSKDAYKLFETINNRGLKLSPTDIIKNFLLGHASLVSDKCLDSVKENWTKLIVSLDGIKTDDFYRHFVAGILKRKVSKSKLIYEFKTYYLNCVKESSILPEYGRLIDSDDVDEDDEDENGESSKTTRGPGDEEAEGKAQINKLSIVEFSKKMLNAAVCYGKLQRCEFDDIKINRSLQNLKRIRAVPSYSFLLNAFQRRISDEQKLKIVGAVETFMMRSHICKMRTSDLDDIFPRLVNLPIENIVKHVKQRLQEDLPGDEEFNQKFATYNFRANDERAKYALECFEYRAIGDQGEYTINSGNEVHLEHIIPKTIHTKKAKRELGDWPSYLKNSSRVTHKEFIDRIGNYTLLAQKLNIKASNNPFREKKKEYFKSNISLTKAVATTYSSFKYRTVEQRSEELAAAAVEIWRL